MDVRQDAMKALRRHKSGWFGLGKALVAIQAKEQWKDWGYEKFWDYAKEELGLSIMTAKDMMMAYEYIKNAEPSTLNIIESNEDAYVPDYHTLASLSKASGARTLSDEKEDEIRDTIFNASEDTAVKANREAKDLLANSSKKDGEEIMDDIKKQTASVKKRMKKLNNDIHRVSSFDNDVQEESDKLHDMIQKVDI
jgi:hypothetical protein